MNRFIVRINYNQIAQKDNTKQAVFEFIGPGRALCLIEAMTDNPKRMFNYLNRNAVKIG